ncbi:MAG: PspC domain-containing protein [Candidatus Pacebacteria bacterium]|nr:PspC domain-containing protein [Candidatus Paceibacterota bacterium]
MKKITSIDLGSLSFSIEEDAYHKLKDYLENVKSRIGNGADKEEVMLDIEIGMAEKLKERLVSPKEIINIKDIDDLILIMGNPEEFDPDNKPEEKEEDIKTETIKKLYRNPDDMIIGGVCGGIGAYFSIDPVFIRILFIILFFSGGIGLPAYVILWIIIPMAETKAQKFQMKGSPLNISTIEQSHKDSKEDQKDGSISSFINNIMKGCVGIVRRLIGFMGPIFRFCFSIMMIGVSLSMVAALIILIGTIISYANSDYYFGNIPISEIMSMVPSFPIMFFTFFALVIPLLFLIIVGLSLITRKKLLNLMAISIFVAAWMISCSVLAILGIRYFPDLMNKFENTQALQTIEKTIEVGKITAIDYSGWETKVILEKGNSSSIRIVGRSVDLQYFSYENVEGRLKLAMNKRENDKKCIGCHQNTVRVIITSPDVKEVRLSDSNLEVNDPEIKSLSIESSDSSINIISNLGKIIFKSQGDRISIGNDISDIEGEMNGSEVIFSGKADKVKLLLNDSTFNGFVSSLKDSELLLKNNSWMVSSFENDPVVDIDKSSGLYYMIGNDKEVMNLSGGLLVRMKEISSIDFVKNEDASNYFKFNERYYIIENKETDDQIYQEYRKNIRNNF